MEYLKKIKDLFLKYWQFLVAGIVVLVGIALGTTNNKSEKRVLRKDLELQNKSSEEIKNSNIQAIEDHKETIENINIERAKAEKEALEQKEKRREELKDNSEELDNILRDKFNLKG